MAVSPKMSAVILDNEFNTSLNLKNLLKTCGDIDLIETTQKFSHGLDVVYKYKPDIFFIDGDTLEQNGSLFLSELSKRNPFTHIVLTCSCEKRASQVFRNIVPDYLINPIDQNKLHLTIERIKDDIRIVELQDQVGKLRQAKRNKKVMLTTKSGFVFVNQKKIVCCQADSNYTVITMFNKKQILVSKSLCHFYKESLPFSQFIRISRSVVINMHYLTEVIKAERKCILEADGHNYSFTASPEYYRLLKKNNFTRCSTLNSDLSSHNNMLSLLNKYN